MPVAEVRALRRQLELRQDGIDAINYLCELGEPTLDALPPSLRCSWGPLDKFEANLRVTAARLSDLSTLGEHSGLSSSLNLAHVGLLSGLCQKESAFRREGERLAKDSGLTEVFDGPKTKIDEIRRAVDFA